MNQHLFQAHSIFIFTLNDVNFLNVINSPTTMRPSTARFEIERRHLSKLMCFNIPNTSTYYLKWVVIAAQLLWYIFIGLFDTRVESSTVAYILFFSVCLFVRLYPINVKATEPIGPKGFESLSQILIY